tara:strand:- start:71343 stop:71750 length:408 start_codon:yes stop_codon:yes gene_type:complete
MQQNIGLISLVVENYDDAIAFYIQKIGFELIQDTKIDEVKRWVVVAPKDSKGCRLLLAKAANKEQTERIGNQTGGRVFLFLYTDDFEKTYSDMVSKGVNFVRPVKEEPYGTIAVFEDLYGNFWDLIEEKHSNRQL